jgi:hypothetical protein
MGRQAMARALEAATVRELAALRRLDLIPASYVIEWAASRIAEGDATESLFRLASLPPDTDANDVETLLSDALHELGQLPISDDKVAGTLVAQRLARDIVRGSIAPYEGAKQIWIDVARRVEDLEPTLRPLIGLASEWEDDNVHRQEYDEDIRRAALDLLQNPDYLTT